MAEQGAQLQSFNNDIVRSMDELCEKRNLLQKDIDKEEQEKFTLETQLKSVQDKLARVNASLNSKYETKQEYDKTISDTEEAYMKIVESSQVLLNVLKSDAAKLNHKGSTTEKVSNSGRGSVGRSTNVVDTTGKFSNIRLQ